MSEKRVWYASGGRKSKPTFSKFVPMLASTPHIDKKCTWRPSWLKNLEQDISIDNKLDNYVMARGGTIQLGRSSKKAKDHSKGEEGKESKEKTKQKPAKWTPKWLWNNHGVEKHSFKREPRNEEEVQLAYESWKNELANRERLKRIAKLKIEREKEEEERLRFTRNIQKNISHAEFCKEAKKAILQEKQRLRINQDKIEKEWADRLEQKKQQVKLMKMKNAIFRKEQKRRMKKGPPGSRKPIKLKKNEKYFAKEKKGNLASRRPSVLSPQKQQSTAQNKQRAKSATHKLNRRDRMSQGDITALYRLSVSPLVHPPKRHGNWQAIRPTSAPKGMPRFLKRLENTTDAPLDMRKPIKKALRRVSSALEIRVTPPRYPAPKLKRKLSEYSLGSPSKDNTSSKTMVQNSEALPSNDNENEFDTKQESKAIKSIASMSVVDDSTGTVERKNGDDNITNRNDETKEDALAREERYRLRRLAAEKEEQEQLKLQEIAKAKAIERMRLVKERDAINKAKEEEEMRKKEMQEIERRLKVNEEKLARRKKAFEEKEKQKKIEEEQLQKSEMHAAQNIQRISRGKLARKRVQKLREDRKIELQNEIKEKESNKEDIESLPQEKQPEGFDIENNQIQRNDSNSNPTTDRDAKIATIESSKNDNVPTNNEKVAHELSKIGDINDSKSTEEVADAPTKEQTN